MDGKKERDNHKAPGEVREIPVGSPDDASVNTTAEQPSESIDKETPASPEIEWQNKCAQLEAKVAELEDQKLRALAELDNYKKRMARQFDETIRNANDRVLVELLEVVDNFERALSHSRDNGDAQGTTVEALREGTELIYNQMKNLLAKYGVQPIEAVGRKFDPTYHEALLEMDSDEHAAGLVAQEINRGYLIDDRVLRHSRVAVSRGPARTE